MKIICYLLFAIFISLGAFYYNGVQGMQSSVDWRILASLGAFALFFLRIGAKY